MKTLDQVEPRTLISSIPITISTRGSYYLTQNLTGTTGQNGITIDADGVTVDLSGFDMDGGNVGSSGIRVINVHAGVTIRNGSVRNWTSSGVSIVNPTSTEFRVEDMRVFNSGFNGIGLGDNGTALRCNVRGATQSCIRAQGTSCKVIECTVSGQTNATLDGITFTGDRGLARACVSSNNTGGGITLVNNAVATDCIAASNGTDGIQVGSGSTVTGCTASNNTSFGFNLGDNSTINNCSATANGSSGFGGASTENCVFNNCAASANSGSGFGLSNAASLHNCSANSNAGFGIGTGSGSTLMNCVAELNTGTSGITVGSGSTLIGCAARSNNSSAGVSSGITTSTECLVSQCVVTNTTSSASPTSLTGMGINVGSSSTVERCVVQGNKADGIHTSASCVVMNNTCDSNGFAAAGDGAGIHSSGSDNRIESNNVTDNDRGIDVDAPGNLIIKNSASGNPSAAGAGNYVLAADNRYGQVVDTNTAVSAAVTGTSSAGNAVLSTNPWANFSY